MITEKIDWGELETDGFNRLPPCERRRRLLPEVGSLQERERSLALRQARLRLHRYLNKKTKRLMRFRTPNTAGKQQKRKLNLPNPSLIIL